MIDSFATTAEKIGKKGSGRLPSLCAAAGDTAGARAGAAAAVAANLARAAAKSATASAARVHRFNEQSTRLGYDDLPPGATNTIAWRRTASSPIGPVDPMPSHGALRADIQRLLRATMGASAPIVRRVIYY
mmetsp:Transcript_1341/g.4995  ORF Transcript_1341/g.4995 Transcript_1341/m.4995 type:complete len:131 (-) Transcript_1341:1220-1612(-)